jgi:hypothetical protein
MASLSDPDRQFRRKSAEPEFGHAATLAQAYRQAVNRQHRDRPDNHRGQTGAGRRGGPGGKSLSGDNAGDTQHGVGSKIERQDAQHRKDAHPAERPQPAKPARRQHPRIPQHDIGRHRNLLPDRPLIYVYYYGNTL